MLYCLCSYIALDDLLLFMRESEAQKALSIFKGGQKSGKISKSALKDFVVRQTERVYVCLQSNGSMIQGLHVSAVTIQIRASTHCKK